MVAEIVVTLFRQFDISFPTNIATTESHRKVVNANVLCNRISNSFELWLMLNDAVLIVFLALHFDFETDSYNKQ